MDDTMGQSRISFANKDIESCYTRFIAPRTADLAQFRYSGFQRLLRHIGLATALPTGAYLAAPMLADASSVYWIQQLSLQGGSSLLFALGGVLALRQHKLNEQNFVQLMVEAAGTHFGKMQYQPQPLQCDSGVFASHGLFNQHSCRYASDRVNGEFKGAKFDMALADLQEITPRKSKKRYFKGMLLDITLPQSWDGEIRLMPKQNMLTRTATQRRMARGGFQFTASEHADFGELFDVYAQSPADADRVLTSERRTALLAIARDWKGKGLHVSVAQNRLLIALPRLTRTLKLDMFSFFRTTPKTLEKNAGRVLSAATLPHRIIDLLSGQGSGQTL